MDLINIFSYAHVFSLYSCLFLKDVLANASMESNGQGVHATYKVLVSASFNSCGLLLRLFCLLVNLSFIVLKQNDNL